MVTILATIFIILCGIAFLATYVVLKGEIWQQVIYLLVGIVCISYGMLFIIEYGK